MAWGQDVVNRPRTIDRDLSCALIRPVLHAGAREHLCSTLHCCMSISRCPYLPSDCARSNHCRLLSPRLRYITTHSGRSLLTTTDDHNRLGLLGPPASQWFDCNLFWLLSHHDCSSPNIRAARQMFHHLMEPGRVQFISVARSSPVTVCGDATPLKG